MPYTLISSPTRLLTLILVVSLAAAAKLFHVSSQLVRSRAIDTCRRPATTRLYNVPSEFEGHQKPNKKNDAVYDHSVQPVSEPFPQHIDKINELTVNFFKEVIGSQFSGRPYARFYALETIARVPYFAYTSVLHLYETIYNFRKPQVIRMHFLESWNELHHLLVMEELGGAEKWTDRVLASHCAFFYYWLVVVLYMASPSTAYNFNKNIEQHAFETYDQFLKNNEAELKAQPVPHIAREYYCDPFSLYYDGKAGEAKQIVQLESLYDVFVQIRDDESEHSQQMAALEVAPPTLN